MPDRTWGDRPDCRVSAAHFHMSALELQNLLTTAMIPTIIFHGNYISRQQKAAGKRSRPRRRNHTLRRFQKKTGLQPDGSLENPMQWVPKVKGNRAVSESLRQKDSEHTKADFYLFFCACRFTGASPVNLFSSFSYEIRQNPPGSGFCSGALCKIHTLRGEAWNLSQTL